MNKNSKTHRGEAFSLVEMLIVICLIALLAALALPQACQAQSYITPHSSYIQGSSNTVVVSGVTTQACVVAAASTNYFNLSVNPNSQSNTNLFPALPLFDPRNRIPFDKVGLYHEYSLMASNGANQTFRYASTPDGGGKWVSNACVIVFNTNGAYASGLFVKSQTETNKNTATMWALQAIENPGPAAISNLVITPSAIPYK